MCRLHIAILLIVAACLNGETDRRPVSRKEATDLVFAYLRSVGCTAGSCVLEPYHDVVGSDFYGFQGLGSTPNTGFNLGYFEVDPRTADLWSGVVCQRYETPSVVRLQKVIRKRIGLTDEEYSRLQRPGPLCDPGEKPSVIKTK